jgi:hypothetical protein
MEIIDDPAAKAAILDRALSRFEPAEPPRVTPCSAVEDGRRLIEGTAGYD